MGLGLGACSVPDRENRVARFGDIAFVTSLLRLGHRDKGSDRSVTRSLLCVPGVESDL
jgi:ketosteroid isomerase-like protein